MFADLLLVWFRFSHKLQLQLQLLLLNIKLGFVLQHPLSFAENVAIVSQLNFVPGSSKITAKSFTLKAQQLCQPRQQTKSIDKGKTGTKCLP